MGMRGVELKLCGVGRPAMDTEGMQRRFLGDFRGKEFSHCGLKITAFTAILFACRLLEQQACCLYFSGHIRQLQLNGLMLGNGFAKSYALLCILNGIVKSCLGNAHRSRGYIDTSDLQATHSMFETLTFNPSQEMCSGNTNSIENKFGRLHTSVPQFIKCAANA